LVEIRALKGSFRQKWAFIVFNNFLLLDANLVAIETYILRVSLFSLSFFANTPFRTSTSVVFTFPSFKFSVKYAINKNMMDKWRKLSVLLQICVLLSKPVNGLHYYSYSYFSSTTKHEILHISNHNLICSLDPPNQGWLFWVVGPKLINNTEYNWLHISRHGKELIGRKEIVRWYVAGWDQRDFYVEINLNTCL